MSSPLYNYYELRVDETCDELTVNVEDGLSNEIKERLMQVLVATKPEDSV